MRGLTSAPRLETERLVLRAHTLDDVPRTLSLWGDPAVVVDFILPTPATEEESWGRFLRYAGHWRLLGYGYWMVETHDGAFVGEVGFANARRAIDPPLNGPEGGWVLTPSAHGKGYATEAVRAALAWLEETHAPPQTVCIIQPDNVASIKVAQKLGYAQTGLVTYRGGPTSVYTRPLTQRS